MASNRRFRFKAGDLLKRKWNGSWQAWPKYILVMELMPASDANWTPSYRFLDLANNAEQVQTKHAVEDAYVEQR